MSFPAKNLPFFNVVGTGKASLELTPGMTYEQVVLELGGTTFTKSMITRIVCKLNTKIFYDLTGDQLDKINKYRGLYDDATHLTIDFTAPEAKTVGGQLASAIGTAEGVNSFTIEIDIAGATSPTLESWSVLSAPRPLGLVLAMVPYPKNFSAGGKFPVQLPHGPMSGHEIRRTHFFHANMTELNVKKNGVEVWQEIPTTMHDFLAKQSGRAIQAGHYCYDPVLSNNMRDALQTANARSLQFDVTVSAADTVTLIGEYVADIRNL